jgi:hypothetical protein
MAFLLSRWGWPPSLSFPLPCSTSLGARRGDHFARLLRDQEKASFARFMAGDFALRLIPHLQKQLFHITSPQLRPARFNKKTARRRSAQHLKTASPTKLGPPTSSRAESSTGAREWREDTDWERRCKSHQDPQGKSNLECEFRQAHRIGKPVSAFRSARTL